MVRSIALATLILMSAAASAASLSVEVRDKRGTAVQDAVVYAIPQGRDLAPARRTAVMDQKNRTFIPHVLAVQTGTAVRFPNSDDIRHQVYSFSAAKTFQLPLYTGTPANPVVFDTAGVVTLGCNIHDRMSAYIVVVDTPHFATTERSGRVELSQLPAGTYSVRVWFPGVRSAPPPVEVTLGASDRKDISFQVTKKPVP
jgi:plastocyanin